MNSPVGCIFLNGSIRQRSQNILLQNGAGILSYKKYVLISVSAEG